MTAGGKPVPLKEASSSNAKDSKAAAAAIDGDPQTGWSIGGGQGREPTGRVSIRRAARECRGARRSRLLFERYHAAGPRPVPDLGDERPAA